MNKYPCDCGVLAKVIDVRPTSGGLYRRHRCPQCGSLFSTVQVLKPEIDRLRDESARLYQFVGQFAQRRAA